MSERRLLPHDLPEYRPNDPPPAPWRRVKVFKEGDHWTWEHTCPWLPASTPASGYPHMTQKIAMAFACDHVKGCL